MKVEADIGTGKKACLVCGAVSKPAFDHCSTGCALAARVPMGKDDLPATWELAVLLGSCFVLFNQFLLLVGGWVKSSREGMGAGDAFLLASLVVGSLWLIFMVVAWATHSPKRLGDYAVGILGFLILVVPIQESSIATSPASRFAFVNLLVSMRLYRGVYYLWRASKKKEK